MFHIARFCVISMKSLQKMIGKSPDQSQRNLFAPVLKEFINPNHPLVKLADQIPWVELEKHFEKLYSHTGTPSMPIRLMAGLLILKRIYNLGDESIEPQWIQNPYFQYFCGESEFQWAFPCDPSDLVHFRKRIGKEGVEKIFKLSVDLQKDEVDNKDVMVDTTVQEKDITFPTDSKLHGKIIEKVRKIAKKEDVKLRQSYTKSTTKLKLKLRFGHHPKRRKEANAAQRKLKTIAGRLVREIERKLPENLLSKYLKEIEIFKMVLAQKKHDKNKIYSLHEPETSCIAKGKVHKKYEFGSKTALAAIPGKNIIVGVVTFKGNPHDSTTLEPTLEHVKQTTGKVFKRTLVDRGYRGKKNIGETEVILPGTSIGKSAYQKRKYRKKCRSRAAIEPIIGHVKQDCRMERNYLKGFQGDEINALLAAAGFNFRRILRKIEADILFVFLKFRKIVYRLTTQGFRLYSNPI